MPPPIVFIVLGIIVLAIILAIVFKKKKGTDTPQSLKEYFSKFVDFMQTLPPFHVVFKEHSNDGNQIVYKEITNSRDCFIRFERYKIILDCYDKNGNQIFYAEDASGIYGGMQDKEFIEKMHKLYVSQLHKGKISLP